MRNFFTIWRRELAACFLSPIAYLVMVAFLSISGWMFLRLAESFEGTNEPLSGLLFRVILFVWMPILVAVITMRLFADEKRSGTIETLMTAPVTDTEVVLGKYAGALSFYFIVTIPSAAYIVLLKILSPNVSWPDIGAIAGGTIIFILLSAFCVSIGLLISLISKNQIIAAIFCFGALWLLLFAGDVLSFLPRESVNLVAYISSGSHILDFARGSIETRPPVLYLSGIFFI